MEAPSTLVPKKRPCCVQGCYDKYAVRRRFPKRAEGNDIYEMWLIQVNNPKLFAMSKKEVCQSYVVCDRHFADDCKLPDYKRLKPGSIPTLFLPGAEDRTEAINNLINRSIDLPTDPTDSSNNQLVDIEELLLNSDVFDLHTVEAQDSFLSTVFKSRKQYNEPQFPIRLPEDNNTVHDTTNNDLNDITITDELEDLQDFLYLEDIIGAGMTDVIKIEVEDMEQPEETEEVGPIEVPLPEKPYFKSVKSYLVDSRSVTEVCRICFRSILDEDMIRLYQEDQTEEANNLRNMIKLVLPDLDLEMYPNSVLCVRCHELLIYSYQLKEMWLTTEEKLQNIINKKRGVTNRDADLVIVAKAVTKDTNKKGKTGTNFVRHVENINNQNICNKKTCGVTTDAKKPEQNVSVNRIWGPEQENGVDEEILGEVRDKLEVINRNDNATNLKNLCSKKAWEVEGLEMEPATVTDEVLEGILSHNDSTANLELVIYHGDLESEKPRRQRDYNNVNEGPNPLNVRSKGIWGLGPYMCEICGNTILKLKALKRHLRNHRNFIPKPRLKREKNKMCELCGQLFTTNRTLRQHTEKHERKLDCTICHKIFKYNRALQLHIQRTHLRQYDYSQCHLCGKQLAYPKSLSMHLLTHNAEKTHVCNICDKRFFFSSLLKKHLGRHTTDMHSCEYCGKALKYQHSLQKHIRIYHHNEAEYRCEFCSRPYWKKMDLVKHKIRVHGWRPELETT